VFSMRVLAPPERSLEVVVSLETLGGVSNVIIGGVTHDRGEQSITADVSAVVADNVFDRLEDLGIDLSAVTLVRKTTVGAVSRRRAGMWFAPGENQLVWAEVVTTARENAVLTPRYCVFMIAAGVIAAFGIILRNPILIVGAMAVSPDLLALSAFSVGVVGRRRRLAVRGLTILTVGLTLTGLSALALSWGLRQAGAYNGVLSSGDALAGIVTSVSSATVIVAVAAGVVGMLAFQTRASTAVGVAISVTTVPAAAFAGVAAGIAESARVQDALVVLLVNVIMLFAGGTLTLLVQRTVGRRYRDR
jgi:uncharacterized hydrophobic protein (TIGR00271 family)